MALIQFEKFNLNNFYEKTPKPLKYILVISLIIVGSYFLFSKKVTTGQVEQLAKIEQSIETTYGLIDRFDEFRTAQYVYNAEILDYLKNIYKLVEELNENTNRKFDLILAQGGANIDQILEKLTLLNESYEKLTEAYTPEELQKPIPTYRGEAEIIPIDDKGNQILSISAEGFEILTSKKASIEEMNRISKNYKILSVTPNEDGTHNLTFREFTAREKKENQY